ncbi:MAG: glycosyltransferase [Planctomycetota bacterium]
MTDAAPFTGTVAAIFHDAGRAGAELVLLTHLQALRARGARIVAVLPRRGPLVQALEPLADRLIFHAAPWWIRLTGSRGHPRPWTPAARAGLAARLETSSAVLEKLFRREGVQAAVTASSVLLSPALAARRAGIAAVQFVHELPDCWGSWDAPLPWPEALNLLRNCNHRLIWSSPACALWWADPRATWDFTYAPATRARTAAAMAKPDKCVPWLPVNSAAAWAARLAAPGGVETFLAHPVDCNRYPAKPPRRLSNGGVLRIVCVGTWSERKGTDVIHRVLEALDFDRVPFHATLVGAQPRDAFTRKLRRIFRQSPFRDRVHFLPFAEDLPALFAASDVLLHPAREDPSPLIVAHALAAGVAVVASNLPGIREMLTGYDPAADPCGVLVGYVFGGAALDFEQVLCDRSQLRHAWNARRAMRLARATFDQPRVTAQFAAILDQALAAAAADRKERPQATRPPAEFGAAEGSPAFAAKLWALRDRALETGRGLIARMR